MRRTLAIVAFTFVAIGCATHRSLPPGTRVATSQWFDYSGKFEHRAGYYVIGDSSVGPTVELNESEVQTNGAALKLRVGAMPRTPIDMTTLRTSTAMANKFDCAYEPTCNGPNENRCTFCVGVLMFCCNGGLKGGCLGAWGCP